MNALSGDLAFIPLGGTGEIGMNLSVYRCDDALLAVDCGLGFAGHDNPEVDVMVPDPAWLAERRDRLVGLLSTPKDEGLKSMSPVWLYFGGPPAEGEAASSTVVLGLLTTQAPVMLGGQPFHGVLVPTAPVPVGGGLLFVPAAWVVPADVGIDRGLTAHRTTSWRHIC